MLNRTPAAFEPRGKAPRQAGCFALRFWAIRHSRTMESLYAVVERGLVSLAPLFGAWEHSFHFSGIRLRNAVGWPETAPPPPPRLS